MRLWSFDRWTAATPLRAHARAAVRNGFAVVFLRPGGKEPLCPLTARERKKAGPQHPCGVAHASRDESWVLRKAKQLTDDYGQVNLGIAAHASGVVVIDADTPEQVESVSDFLRQLGDTAAILADQPTVKTPGAQRDGVWVHEHGTHWYFNRPDELELPEHPGHMTLAGGAVMRWGNSYTLVPPSVREEGPYVSLAEYIVDLPVGLASIILNHVQDRLDVAVDLMSQFHDDRIVEWSLRTPWHTLLEPDGWFFTGKLDRQCGCPVWRRPGDDTSTDRSAIAHEDDCTRLPNYEGHGALYVFSDNPPGLLADAVARGRRTFTKLQYVALMHYDGDETAAKVALGIEVDPADIAAWLEGTGETGESTGENLASALTRDDGRGNGECSPALAEVIELHPKPASEYQRIADREFMLLAARAEAVERFAALKRRQTGARDPVLTWKPAPDFIETYFAVEAELGPTVMHDTEGNPYFYRYRVNGIAGRRAAGKTWNALLATAQELEAGHRVLYYDMEDRLSAWRERLNMIGCPIDDYVRSEHGVWVKPGDLPNNTDRIVEVASEFDLVVFDVMNRLITRRGGNPDVGNEQVGWIYDNLLDPIAALGPAVLVLDHPNRRGQRSDATLDDMGPGGGAMKMNHASGHVLGMRVRRAFSRKGITKATEDQRPMVELVSLKDRSGRFEEGAVVGVLRGDMEVWGMKLYIDPPVPVTIEQSMAEDEERVCATILRKLKHLATKGQGMRKGAIQTAVHSDDRWMIESALVNLSDRKEIHQDSSGVYRAGEGPMP